ncbi:MAG: hypothetical protein GY870_07790 [archaeon]|nr:hypothetical protein [archaeon]
MTNFKFVLSTNRTFEKVAAVEFWFNLLILGDSNPITIEPAIPGLLLIDSKLNPFEVIKELKKILLKDSDFFQYILKIIPIDRVVGTNLKLMKTTVNELLIEKSEITSKGNFAINIRKRSTNLHTKEIIDEIAEGIENKVNLKKPDWIIQIEIIGEDVGISILTPDDIFSVIRDKRKISSTKKT